MPHIIYVKVKILCDTNLILQTTNIITIKYKKYSILQSFNPLIKTVTKNMLASKCKYIFDMIFL